MYWLNVDVPLVTFVSEDGTVYCAQLASSERYVTGPSYTSKILTLFTDDGDTPLNFLISINNLLLPFNQLAFGFTYDHSTPPPVIVPLFPFATLLLSNEFVISTKPIEFIAVPPTENVVLFKVEPKSKFIFACFVGVEFIFVTSLFQYPQPPTGLYHIK